MIVIIVLSQGISRAIRNSLQQVRAYLDQAHEKHCQVFNLTDTSYDVVRLGHKLAHFGWPAGQAPPLARLFCLCKAIHSWLLEDPKNVVALHCLTGKGETGVAVAAYLLYCQMFDTPVEATRLFTCKRMLNNKRVMTASQMRYVAYIGKIVNGETPHTHTVYLRELTLQTVPTFNARSNGCRPYAEVYVGNQKVKSTLDDAPPEGLR